MLFPSDVSVHKDTREDYKIYIDSGMQSTCGKDLQVIHNCGEKEAVAE